VNTRIQAPKAPPPRESGSLRRPVLWNPTTLGFHHSPLLMTGGINTRIVAPPPPPRPSACEAPRGAASCEPTEDGSDPEVEVVDEGCREENQLQIPEDDYDETAAASPSAKARAVAALQKFFFEELSCGQDPNGAAASALRRLTELPDAGDDSPLASHTDPQVDSMPVADSAGGPVTSTCQPPHVDPPQHRRPNPRIRHHVAVQN